MTNSRYLGGVMVAIALTGVASIPAAAAPNTGVNTGADAISHWDTPRVAVSQTMPNLVGKPLPAAYKELDSSTRITTKDLSGGSRPVLWPSNWKICTQNPKSGAAIAVDAAVVLGVVKKTEDCP